MVSVVEGFHCGYKFTCSCDDPLHKIYEDLPLVGWLPNNYCYGMVGNEATTYSPWSSISFSHPISDVRSCTTVYKHLGYIGIVLPGPRESSPTILHTISHNITTVMYACKLADQSYLILNVCLGSSLAPRPLPWGWGCITISFWLASYMQWCYVVCRVVRLLSIGLPWKVMTI